MYEYQLTGPASHGRAAPAILSCGHVEPVQAAGDRRRRANHPDLRTPAHLAVTEAHGQGRKRACQAETQPNARSRGQTRPPSHGRPSSPADGKDTHAMTTSLTRRPETGGGSPPAVPATTRYLLPATGRGTAARAAAAPGTLTGPRVALSPVFILLPSRYPPLAASGAPARVLAVTTRGRPGPRRARKGETS